MPIRRLIRNATVISVDPAIGTLPRADILIEGERILAVGPDLGVGDADVIDGVGRIALPGLIDAHRHLWMTLMRGTVSDGTWSSYLVETFWGRRNLFTAEDHHAATLAGCCEALEAGVTTLLDFHDASTAPGAADACIDALEESGIRAVFAYGLEGAPELPDGRPAGVVDLCPSQPWHRDEATALRRGRLASDDRRVTMGITVRNLDRLPWSCTEEDLGLARALGVRTTTTHAGSGALSGGASWIAGLARHGLLGPDLLLSHGQSFSGDELDLLASAGVKIVVSAESEMGQGGDPVTWRALQHGVTVAIGADSVGSVSGDLFRHMQITLKAARGSRNRLLDAQGIAPTDVATTAADMLEIATMGGARALRMEDRIGSLTPGKQADVILLARDRIGMNSGASPEQVAVLQANGADVETVLVAGCPRKRDGRLVGVDTAALGARLDRARERMEAAYDPAAIAPIWAAYRNMVSAGGKAGN